MFVIEYKLKGSQNQYRAIDEAIRTGQFVRNKALRLWMDAKREDKISKYDLNKYCAVLAKDFDFAKKLNSTARQSSAERAWSAISRFYDNCKKRAARGEVSSSRAQSKQQIKGKKQQPAARSQSARESLPIQGFPKFKKYSRSVEYKHSGWRLNPQTKKHITFTDKIGIGKLKLIGSRDIYFYQPEQIKRVRLLRRADGYYCQFCISIEVKEELKPANQNIGLDIGLKYFYADSNGNTKDNPKFYRKSERRLNRLNRRKSKKYRKGQKQSKNYQKARIRAAITHLKVSRQREEHAKRLARCVVRSNDVIAYEDLNVLGLVKNRKLSKSISDAGWSSFRKWIEYFGFKFGKITVAVPPHYTSQDCPKCEARIKKSLSTRTHICKCGYVEDRDIAASMNILKKGLSTVGHTGSRVWGDLPSGLVGENLLGDGESTNQKPHRGSSDR